MGSGDQDGGSGRGFTKQKDGGKVSLYRGSSSTSLSKCIMWVCFAGGPAQRVSSLATKRRGGRGGPWQGIVNENGASQHRPIRRQPSASASRPWAATSDEALQAPKTTSTCTPTNPQPPPREASPKKKKATKKGMPCTALFVLTKGHPQRSKNSPHSATQQAPSFCRRCMQLPSRIVVLVR